MKLLNFIRKFWVYNLYLETHRLTSGQTVKLIRETYIDAHFIKFLLQHGRSQTSNRRRGLAWAAIEVTPLKNFVEGKSYSKISFVLHVKE